MMRRKPLATTRAGLAALLLLGTSLSGAAFAQVPDTQTTIADPGRVSDRIREEQVLPQVSPRVEVRNLAVQKAPEGAENIRLSLNSLQLDGVTAYSAEQLLPVYQDRLGQSVTLAEVYGIAADLTRKYRNDGYILTQVVVPPQTIQGGNVKLQVVEGFIDSVSVEGEQEGEARALMQRYASYLQSGKALNVRDLERYLLLINDLPGVDARSVLSPSSQTGAANLRIITTRDPFDALVGIDNHGSRYLGPLQLSGVASLNNFFGVNDRVTGQLVVAPELADEGFEMAYVALAYQQPIFDNGTTLEVFFSHTDTEPGFNLDQFDVEGRSQYYSVKAEHPIIRTRALNLYGHALFDWRDVESKNNVEPTRRDRIRALRAGGRLEFLDTIFGVGINSASVEVSQGLDIFGSSDEGDLRLTRPQGDPTFTKLEAEIQRLQRINPEVNLLVAARGQWSADQLLASEEFGVGGVNYGRGFDPSEIIGDEGVAGKVELQWNEPYEWSLVEDYQLFSFFDAGRVWNSDASASNLQRDTLTSAGVGVRADFTEETEAGLTVAFPLNRDIATQQDDDPRVYMHLNRRF